MFYLAGVDVLENDKLGRLSMTINGCRERDKFVLKLAKKIIYLFKLAWGRLFS